jgi:hypothetical protein
MEVVRSGFFIPMCPILVKSIENDLSSAEKSNKELALNPFYAPLSLTIGIIKRICLFSNKIDQTNLFSTSKANHELALRLDLEISDKIFREYSNSLNSVYQEQDRLNRISYLTENIDSARDNLKREEKYLESIKEWNKKYNWPCDSDDDSEENSTQPEKRPTFEEIYRRAEGEVFNSVWTLKYLTEKLSMLQKPIAKKHFVILKTDSNFSNRTRTIELKTMPGEGGNVLNLLKGIKKVQEGKMLLNIQGLIINLGAEAQKEGLPNKQLSLRSLSEILMDSFFDHILGKFKIVRFDYPIFDNRVNSHSDMIIAICKKMKNLKSLTLRPLWASCDQIETVNNLKKFAHDKKITLHYDIGSPYDPVNIAQNGIFPKKHAGISASIPLLTTYPHIASQVDKEYKHYLIVKKIEDGQLASKYDLELFCKNNSSIQIDYHFQNKFGFSLLNAAVFYAKQPDLVQLIIEKNPEAINRLDPHGKSALGSAVMRCTKPGLNLEAIQKERIIGCQILSDLIAAGADVNMLNSKGETALDVCSYARNEDAAQLLKQHGAKHNAPPKEAPPKKLLFVVDKDKLRI